MKTSLTQPADVQAAQAAPATLPRLVSRLFRGARPGAQARLLAMLVRPLGSLGLAAVASGAFAGIAARRRGAVVEIGLDEVGRFTGDQVLELSRFVEQVDPDALQLLASDIVASPAGFTAFGIAAALLVLRAHRRRVASRAGIIDARPTDADP